ncbi:MAG: hypothetical protein ACFFF4_14030, partial [Candidatus Thorarchaeota archaeon]
EGAIADLEEGIRIARKYDDRYQASVLLFLLGNRKMRVDVNESWQYFDEAFRTADSIRHIQGAAFAINSLAIVARIRGEYDLALQSIFRAREMLVDAGVWTGFTALNCSRVYYSMQDGSQALLWARTTSEEMGDSGAIVSVFERTRALILFGRLSDASSELKTANELVLKDSREEYFGQYKYVTGLLEVAEGKTLEGISSLEEALNIFEQTFNEGLVVPCLVDLAKAEVKNYDIGGDLDTSGPWMAKLEQRARERDYPGILMEHALLKAEFQMKQGTPEAARKTLSDALNIYDSPSVKTLRTRILGRIQEIPII